LVDEARIGSGARAGNGLIQGTLGEHPSQVRSIFSRGVDVTQGIDSVGGMLGSLLDAPLRR
jgi:hypothetical protein